MCPCVFVCEIVGLLLNSESEKQVDRDRECGLLEGASFLRVCIDVCVCVYVWRCVCARPRVCVCVRVENFNLLISPFW